MKPRQTDLDALVQGLAQRDKPRTEANVQSDLHRLLLEAPFDLEEADLRDLDVVLEQQAGDRKRIDVEAGFCVFEVKKDLRKGNVRTEAEGQLAGYVRARTEAMAQRYVGVLTDGAEWILYHAEDDQFRKVSSFEVEPTRPDVEGLCVWLEGVLATAEKITPTPKEIIRRLGAESPGHALDNAELSAIYALHRDLPTVQLKRKLWARLLTSALGTGFTDSDELFVDHTLLVATAEVIAHAVVGIDPTAQAVTAAQILGGSLFAKAGVHGVVEADFFDWIVEVKGGDQFVKALARRLVRFAWHEVEHDVLKVLYESVIPATQRKKLGEYYTPDWLADRIVDAVVKDPLHQKVLDPSCGSGTFLFHAIRRYLDAATAAGASNADALEGLTQRVIGMDLHPVAITFARVTYLLAIGTDRLSAEDRPALSVPVYLGDSIQWGQEQTLFKKDALVIPTLDDQPWDAELRFPDRTLANAGQFERLVTEITDLASHPRAPGAAAPSLQATFKRYKVHPEDQPVIEETFKKLCRLHDEDLNHIWGYYVRNLARPKWMAQPENRVDVLVGNPPWLSYRFMTPAMQQEFRSLCTERKLWAGAAVATNQDLSALFVLRSVERYLRDGGEFGFVMPWSILRGQQYEGFRGGQYSLEGAERSLAVAFKEPWDLHAVKPSFFPVPASVVFGERGGKVTPMPASTQKWSGKLPQTNLSWPNAEPSITRETGEVSVARESEEGEGSPYAARFSQGATVLPRVLLVVVERKAGPLGAGAGRKAVESRRSSNEKMPWKDLPPISGNVEARFVRDMHLGETVLSYMTLQPFKAIIPWDKDRLLGGEDDRIADFQGLQDWWDQAESLWNKNRKKESLTLRGRLDYQRGLTGQFPIPKFRVVYTKSGMYMAASIVTDESVIDHKLYWGAADSLQEARYLEAILNSTYLTEWVRPRQARGEHNPRDFDKYVLQAPIPIFDPNNESHLKLAHLAEQAEQIASGVKLPVGKKFEALRKLVRDTIAASEVGKQIEEEVASLLGQVAVVQP